MILNRDRESAAINRERLEQRVRSLGFALRQNVTASCLHQGDSIEWLGYEIGKGERDLRVVHKKDSLDNLEDALIFAHEEPRAPLRANEIILGWISQQGAAYGERIASETLERIRILAKHQSFEDIPVFAELKEAWARSSLLYKDARRQAALMVVHHERRADGSARLHSTSAQH